ncbi:amino acid ABC transporter substrate-binding protein [Candidatus Magnetomorum sp. HK-1]|nr:amino acid ABC transporter substrate-binding protein [Candidatus Magnetomorum sp. HK-1]
MKKRVAFIVFIIIFVGIFTASLSIAKNIVIKAHCRHRPPEMFFNENTKKCEGPLVEILNEAINQVDGTINWDSRPFQKSFSLLKRGKIDILPRVIKTKEREDDVKYFSPIGYQVKPILFAVKEGHENDIKSFDDLLKYRIGAKRGTSYFEEFNENKNIYKIFGIDDSDLSKKFIGGRCDSIILLDVRAFEKMMKFMKFKDFTYAKYRYLNKIGNHYAMSLESKNLKLFDKIDNIINKMTSSGRIKSIYLKYKLEPPINPVSLKK